MEAFKEFLQSNQVMALLVATLIFFITIFLVVKRKLSFSLTFLLLLFALVAGIAISQQGSFKCYVRELQQDKLASEDFAPAFKKQIVQAVEDLKLEVTTEKESLKRIASQVHEIFEQVDYQKQKLQHFIEETRESFKAESQERFNSVEKEHTPSLEGGGASSNQP